MKRFAASLISIILGALILCWTLLPVVWMALSSFKASPVITTSIPRFLFKPTLSHYDALLFGGNNLIHYAVNSIVIVVASTIIAVGLGCLAGYGMSQLRFKGKHHLEFWIISTRMAPIAAVIPPLYVIFMYFNLLDSYTGMILAYLSFNLPFSIWLMAAFFRDLPSDLSEAAFIDGATHWQVFRHIALPLVSPGIATTAILCFIFAWNDYSFASTFAGPSSETIPMAAAQLLTQTGIDWGKLLAIGTLMVLPMVLFGVLVKRWLVTGLTMGAVK